MNGDDRYLAILGLGPGATLADVRTAYRRLAKRNHPDLFPDGQRARQQLRMMRVNEAYLAALAGVSGRGDTRPGSDGAESFRRARADTTRSAAPGPERSVGFLRDPAYVYYKQGFRYYNLGATELFRKEASRVRRSLMTEGSADAYILRLALRAVHYFERSYRYFLVVVESYPLSPWAADARWKLRRLAKFSSVYQRICENLSRRSSTRRSSFSIVSGADPS